MTPHPALNFTPMQQALNLLRANYYRWYAEIGAVGLAAWADQFKGIDPEIVARAITAHARLSNYPPSVNDILRLVDDGAATDSAWHAIERIRTDTATATDKRALAMPGCDWRDKYLDLNQADQRRRNFRDAWEALRREEQITSAKAAFRGLAAGNMTQLQEGK